MTAPRKSTIGLYVVALLIANTALLGSARACERVQMLDGFEATQAVLSDWTCSVFQSTQGTKGTSCHRAFAFRDPTAVQLADVLWKELQKCRQGLVLGPDALVNHPDSYDLRTWETESQLYRVSVKDKGALRKTLVFLRLEPRAFN